MPVVGSVAVTNMQPLCDLPVVKQRLWFLSSNILSKICSGSKPTSDALVLSTWQENIMFIFRNTLDERLERYLRMNRDQTFVVNKSELALLALIDLFSVLAL
jgi:hypothetical protein